MANYNSTHTGSEIDKATTTGLKLSIKVIDCSDNTQWDSANDKPTLAVMQDIATSHYDLIKLNNVPVFEGVTVSVFLTNSSNLDFENVHQSVYYRYDEGDSDEGEHPAIETYVFTNEEEDPTDYKMIVERHDFPVSNSNPSNE